MLIRSGFGSGDGQRPKFLTHIAAEVVEQYLEELGNRQSAVARAVNLGYRNCKSRFGILSWLER
jgi:hypothetical protein